MSPEEGFLFAPHDFLFSVYLEMGATFLADCFECLSPHNSGLPTTRLFCYGNDN